MNVAGNGIERSTQAKERGVISKNVSIIYGLVDHISVHKSCTGPVQPYINFQFMYKTIYY